MTEPPTKSKLRALSGAMDQVFSSLSNGLIIYAIAVVASVGDFGRIALLMTLLAAAIGVLRGSLGTPLLLSSARSVEDVRREGSFAATTALVVAPIVGISMILVSDAAIRPELFLLLAAVRPRTALCGLVAGSFVGLGFEVVENVVQSLSTAVTSSPPGHPSQWASLVTDVIHEVVRRSWTGHIVITGIAGFGIAYAMTAVHRPVTRRVVVASALVGVAVAGHLLWNSHRFGVFYVLGQFGILVLYLCLIRVGRRQEAGCATAVAPQS